MTGVRSINAITFATADMTASIDFYRGLGFEVTFGGVQAPFSTLSQGDCFVNLTSVAAPEDVQTRWGRVIFHVDDVDALYESAVAAGLEPAGPPRDAPWGERMFPIFDPNGHDLSFAKPLR
ncbi:MAG: VOC family protein [Actinomycetota bacterium]|jgi:catechol 2,3-dioxygenase-like lactoylglutathione lyase family enzyme|nr:VOC family protein [Actinomycetota bacterium]